jgi:hypothetical protein
MAFPIFQSTYNVKFFSNAQVPVETEAHRAHAREQRQAKKRTCAEQKRDSGAWAHDARLWVKKTAHMWHMTENEKSEWISLNSTWNWLIGRSA